MNKYTEIVAKKLAAAIEQQKEWLDNQEKDVTQCLIGECRNKSYDLRQHVQAQATGEQTHAILLKKFETECGMTYEAYCEANKPKESTDDASVIVKKFFALVGEIK